MLCHSFFLEIMIKKSHQNDCLCRITSSLAATNLCINPTYIHSLDNKADPLSMGKLGAPCLVLNVYILKEMCLLLEEFKLLCLLLCQAPLALAQFHPQEDESSINSPQPLPLLHAHISQTNLLHTHLAHSDRSPNMPLTSYPCPN